MKPKMHTDKEIIGHRCTQKNADVNIWVYLILLFLCFCSSLSAAPEVEVGIDRLMSDEYSYLFKDKRIGIITNHTAVNSQLRSTVDVLKKNAKDKGYKIVALFGPEHGITGAAYAWHQVDHETDPDGIPVYNLHGKNIRPTNQMLKGIDMLVYDIQDIGSRSYSYSTTLFYAMEEAAKRGITVVVLDRPNPINGLTVDGPMVDEKYQNMRWRPTVCYINVPYCHGMTIGELARFFNGEYKVGCNLVVVPMKGWKRKMSFEDTGLPWIPTSPHIPEARTALHYPTTGILGMLKIVNTGVWYSLPFKVIGAPWIDAERFADQLNEQNFPGVTFKPFHYQPYFGRYAKQLCHGILIVVTDTKKYQPVSTQYFILGMIKSLYPDKYDEALASAKSQKKIFDEINGTEKVYEIMANEKYIAWSLRSLDEEKRKQFMGTREKYLIPIYSFDTE